MGYLIAVLAAPAAGPALYRILHGHPRAARVVDGSVYVAVPALVAWQVLPHAWAERSLLAIGAVGVGLLLPLGMERVSRALAPRTDDVALLAGLSGIVVHALLEGAALVPGSDEGVATPLALAVVLHRIPVGLVIWWLIRPRHGVAAASAGVGSLILATLVGFGLGGLLGEAHGSAAEIYQALVSGSLVHVVFHQGRHDHDHREDHHGNDSPTRTQRRQRRAS